MNFMIQVTIQSCQRHSLRINCKRLLRKRLQDFLFALSFTLISVFKKLVVLTN